MELNCEGCAGCCIDWRSLSSDGINGAEHSGDRIPVDNVYNFTPLTRDDLRTFLKEGYSDFTYPRVWEADGEHTVEIDGREIVALEGKPVFYVGLRKTPKPIAPFGIKDPKWIPTCVFLDPTTLQCRIHDNNVYPGSCADYPGQNLKLGVKTECERVEDVFGGERLLNDDPPDEFESFIIGRKAIGEKLFVHPEPERLNGVVMRLARDELKRRDRHEFLSVALAGRPGTTEVNREVYEETLEKLKDMRSWVTKAIRDWEHLFRTDRDPIPENAKDIEDDRGASPTPGW
ncbi:MAG: YkgJ family cysteine cluster protein [Halobacteria archaeon]|nr:YkgJ family cysteine cluster protein [Halobacteria archaeon]